MLTEAGHAVQRQPQTAEFRLCETQVVGAVRLAIVPIEREPSPGFPAGHGRFQAPLPAGPGQQAQAVRDDWLCREGPPGR